MWRYILSFLKMSKFSNTSLDYFSIVFIFEFYFLLNIFFLIMLHIKSLFYLFLFVFFLIYYNLESGYIKLKTRTNRFNMKWLIYTVSNLYLSVYQDIYYILYI